jgi:hypothetical protein
MSSSEQTQLVYPPLVLDRIGEISQKTSIPVDTLKVDYEAIFLDPFIQKDPQFQNDDERHKFAVATLWTRFVGRAPLFDVSVIPVGVTPKRLSKAGKLYASLFVLVKDKSGVLQLKRVSFNGDNTSQLSEITNFNGYVAKLGKFKGTEDYIADSRTKWENPHPLPAERKPADLLKNLQAIKRIPLDKVSSYPSARDAQGYANTLDWRVVRAMVWRKQSGVAKNGTEWAQYVIGDDTTGREDKVGKDGKVIPAGLTVWCDKSVNTYNVEDECDFYGTIDISKKDSSISMNAYLVLPVHARPAEAGA